MTKRKRRSTRERANLFESHKGICHICGLPIQAGEKWEWSHPRPLALGGEDTVENAAPAHFKCHRALTAKEDIPRIAKAKRQHARHIGAKAPTARPLKGRGFAKSGRKPRGPLANVLPVKNLYEPKETNGS